eukprot:11338443-Karenia_brevis.AAC.1
MSQHSSRANLAAIYYALGTLDHVTTSLKRQSCCYLLHFGQIGSCHNRAQELILLLFATLRAHRTMSQQSSRANLAAICDTLGTLEHVTT